MAAMLSGLSIADFANDVLSYLDNMQIAKADIFGYSMGGYTGVYLARHFPDRVNKIITLATKFYWDETIAAKEIKMLDAGTIEQKLPDFGAALAARHAPADWKLLLQRTAAMLEAMGKNNPLTEDDYKAISHNILLMSGDRDKMVPPEETLAAYKAFPAAKLMILPGTGHPIEQVDLSLLDYTVNWLQAAHES